MKPKTDLPSIKVWLSSTVLAVTLSACGGGGGSGAPDAPISNAAFAGIWSGTTVSSVSGTRIGVNGVALPTGEMLFFAYQDCHVFNGTVEARGSAISLTSTAEWKDYCQGVTEFFPVGWDAHSASPTYTQTFTGQGSFTPVVSASLNYAASLGDAGTVNLNYWSIYDRTSSLAKLEGTYRNSPSLLVTINADGSFSGTELVPGFVVADTRHYSGSFSIIDPSKNIYRLNLIVDGKAFHGFAFLTDSAAGKSEDAIQLAAVQASWGPFVHYWIRR